MYMNLAIGAGIVILSLSLLFVLAPVIGSEFESATPALSASSGWNSSYNTGLPTGAGTWETLSPLLIVIALVFMAALVLITLRFVA